MKLFPFFFLWKQLLLFTWILKSHAAVSSMKKKYSNIFLSSYRFDILKSEGVYYIHLFFTLFLRFYYSLYYCFFKRTLSYRCVWLLYTILLVFPWFRRQKELTKPLSLSLSLISPLLFLLLTTIEFHQVNHWCLLVAVRSQLSSILCLSLRLCNTFLLHPKIYLHLFIYYFFYQLNLNVESFLLCLSLSVYQTPYLCLNHLNTHCKDGSLTAREDDVPDLITIQINLLAKCFFPPHYPSLILIIFRPVVKKQNKTKLLDWGNNRNRKKSVGISNRSV